MSPLTLTTEDGLVALAEVVGLAAYTRTRDGFLH
jgi:hypothetical protein